MAVDRDSDSELVSRCNTGDRDEAIAAFEVLYRRHKDYVLSVAFRYLRDTDLALDVLQETFSWLLKQFPPPGSGLTLSAKLETLLYTVAKNRAIDLLRRNARDGEALDPDTLAADAGGGQEIDKLLHGLSPREREIVLLRFVDDLSLADIAEALAVPLGTAKSRLHKAVKSLRNSPYVKDFFEK